MIDLLMSFLALAIPTLTGIVLLRCGQRSGTTLPYGHPVAVTALGYLLGTLLVTVMMRLSSLVGIPFSFVGLSLAVLAIGAAGLALTPALRRRAAWRIPPSAVASQDASQALAKLVALLLLALVSVRFAMLAAEVLWRPLYPWDAWAQWATKAHAWYASGTLAPFVWPHEWLAMRSALVFTDQAPHYPATVPLLQVWHALAIGRFDESWINLPWVAAGAALVAVFHGQVRALGLRVLPAAVATYALASLPFLNTHIALAGYADLHIGVYYGVAAMLLMRWVDAVATAPAGARPWSTWGKGARRLLILAFIFALALPFIKRPGLFWAASLFVPFVILLLPRAGGWILLAISVLAVTTLFLLSHTGIRIFNYQLVTDTDYAEVAKSLAQNFFAMGNWHLFWYVFVATLLLGLKVLWKPRNDAHTAVVGYGFVFLGCVFFFSVAGDWVSDFTTVNRAIIHMVPMVAFYMVLILRYQFPEWLQAAPPKHGRPAPPSPLPTAVPAPVRAPDSLPVFAPVSSPSPAPPSR
jgi:hypothetical protein